MSAKRTFLSRREFLRVAGSAAFAASAGSLLAGCVPPPAGTTAPAEATTAPAAAPTSKNVVLAIQAFAHDALKPVIAEWEQQTGMTVTLESGPTTGQEMMTKYSPAFQSKTSPVDVVSVDDVSGPAFARAGWLIPLDDVIPAETWQDFPESFLPPVDQDPFHSYEGKRYRVPHEFAVGYFWHRKDWFDEKGVTVPDLGRVRRIGKEFTQDPVWGTTEGMLKPGLPFVYLAYLTVQAGGDIFKFDEATATAFSTAMT